MWTDRQRLVLRPLFLAGEALNRALARMDEDAGPTPDQDEMLEAMHQICNATQAIIRRAD